jgi:quinol monooxygenase YgiN
MADDEERKGVSIFHDVFRRADKNDDGALTLEEFKDFFTDGILSDEELERLFHEIDVDKSNNLNTTELCNYFVNHWGPFGEIFGALEDLNPTITKALNYTFQAYKQDSFFNQFATRFMMKEVANQLRALDGPITVASEKLDEETLKSRPHMQQATLTDAAPVSSPLGSKQARRLARLQSYHSDHPDGRTPSSSLATQVLRLTSLIDRLESKVHVTGIEEEHVAEGECNDVVVVLSELTITEVSVSDFKSALQTYCEASKTQDGCHHIFLRSFASTTNFAIYEVWDSQDSWQKHFSSKSYKAFQKTVIDYLEAPQAVKVMPMPASWWQDSQ